MQDEFEAYLKCGRLEEGFLRVRCEQCRAEKLVAFSCKKRAFCPSCGARRMAETAALLVDEVLPRKPLRQWVLSVPFALRFLLATHRQAVVALDRDACMFEPFDFLARLAALVPLPGVHFTRYHGVFAPASALRGAITPAGRGRGAPPEHMSAPPQPGKHVSMSWMQRLKRVFSIDIQTCQRCGGALKVIASIEDRVLIDRILAHLEQRAEHEAIVPFPSRGPPQPFLL